MSAHRRLVTWLRSHPCGADVVLAGAVTVAVQYDTWTNGWVTGSRPAYAVAGLAMTLPLAWRARRPLAVAVVVFGTLIVETLVAGEVGTPDTQLVAWIVATYSVAAHCDRPRALLGGGLGLGATINWIGLDDLPFPLMVIGGAWIGGRLMRGRQLLVTQLAQRTAELELEREREAHARAVVAAERARIARELHDVVAHSISVMGVQAGAVRRLLHPEQAEQRDALAHAPPPTMTTVDELVAQMCEAGLRVELSIEGEPVSLSPGMELSVYRILQEALTNTLKHAGPAHVKVLVRYRQRELQLDVVDDGQRAAANGAGGHGLVGMRKRVALYGGELHAGPQLGGGYAVHARLPLDVEGR